MQRQSDRDRDRDARDPNTQDGDPPPLTLTRTHALSCVIAHAAPLTPLPVTLSPRRPLFQNHPVQALNMGECVRAGSPALARSWDCLPHSPVPVTLTRQRPLPDSAVFLQCRVSMSVSGESVGVVREC
eukprot:1902277-Rhodomonas_salina.3